ncbi:unnamed protein product [Rotaria sordida]|uniref:Uncharacterized protein n=1 Tax=Rotaria sordida TaxID=392033 RepID=A0A815XIA3_9BILA|nr:unnamed protein product [Rotaria sordida]CAF1675796.1 unnamed protein product [Rotaria sordida]
MNSMNYTYDRSKTLIVQRLQTIQRQPQQASQALQDFGNQPLPQCLSGMNPPLDFTTLSAMVTAVVRKAIQNRKKMEEQIEILKHRIHSNFLPPAFNPLGYSLDRIEKMLNGSKQSSSNDNDNKQQTILALIA